MGNRILLVGGCNLGAGGGANSDNEPFRIFDSKRVRTNSEPLCRVKNRIPAR